MPIKIYDTTLRDGAQMEGLSFSVNDKIKIAESLIDFGIGFIEGGFPGSNPKDDEFFKKAAKLNWKNSNLVAFCSTRHKNNEAKNDPILQKILEANVQYVTVFGKTWNLHSHEILKVSEQENLAIIHSTIDYLTKKGKTVFFDAEHFFDGIKNNKNFTMHCLETAIKAGAKNLTLCDTNGGCLPWEIEKYTKEIIKEFSDMSIGIHTHNDSGLAEANAIMAVKAGADLVQGTINGYGERTGNANLCVILPNLALKMACKFEPTIDLKKLFLLAGLIAEIANTNPPRRAPFVGHSTFTHKAGIHVSAISKNTRSYEHIHPESVGNSRKISVSELSGKANICMLAKNLNINLENDTALTKNILKKIKLLEAEGYVFEGADASFKLLIKKEQLNYLKPFEIVDFLILDRLSRGQVEAEVQIKIGDKIQTEIAFGNGPVNALDKAFKKAMIPFFPILNKLHLSDYKVRIIDGKNSTAAKTRVSIESKIGNHEWTTIGCDENIIIASMHAMSDALEYAILEHST